MTDYKDPFATPAPAPETAAPATNEGPWGGDTSQVSSTSQKPNLSEEGYGVSVTFKYSGKYEDPWVVLRTATVQEMDALLSGPQAEVVARLVDRVSQVARSAERVHNTRSAAPAAGTYGQPAGANTPPPAPSNDGAPSCQHGKRTFREGNGKNGPWKAWFCSARDKNEQCAPKWVDN